MTDLDCAAKAVSALLEMGSDCVVLTLGDKGLLYSQQLRDREGAGGITWDNSGYIPAEKVDVVDTTVSAGGGGATTPCFLCQVSPTSVVQAIQLALVVYAGTVKPLIKDTPKEA